MSESSRQEKWTPGPWAITQRHNAFRDEIGVMGRAVCTVWTRQPPPIREQGTESIAWPEGEANANLIVTAPTLYEVLKELLAAEGAPYPCAEAGLEAQTAWAERRRAARENARSALSASRGEQPTVKAEGQSQ